MSPRRPSDFEQERAVILFDHGAVTADTDYSFWQAPRPFRIVDVRYLNPTGFAEDATDYCSALLLLDSDEVVTLFDASSETLEADAFVNATASLDADYVVGAADSELVLSLVVVDGGGTPTLPAGRIQVEIVYL